MTTTHPMLGALISPALFFGGASAVAAPILIHLLARRRFKRIRWAAMDFLIDAERRNRRRIRMEEWILLALRCLAVILIALMIARPFLKPASPIAFLGGANRIERVFILDDSYSMAYETAAGSVFDRAKEAVRRVLTSVRRDSPDDTVTMLRTSAPTAPVESGTFLDDTQTEELLARLDALTPTQHTMDAAAVIQGAVEVLERSPDVTSVVVYLISDFQRRDWGPVAASAQPERETKEIMGPLAAWMAESDRGAHVVLIDVGETQASNLALTELTLTGGRLVAGATGTARATATNFGNQSAENVELQVSVGNLDQPSRTLRELATRQRASVDLEVEFFRAGSEGVRVELPPDGVAVDNVRYATADVSAAIRVLIVDGEPSPDPYDDEVTFLATALRPEGEVFSGNEAVVVDEAGLDEANLSGFHVVVLANVYRISEPAVEALERFVRRGGGLLVFLGDQVDADLFNGAFYRDGDGLLPAELTQIIRAPDASHLIVTDRLHPAMRGLSRAGDPLGIGDIGFYEYFGCVPYEGEQEDAPKEPDEGAPPTSAAQAARVVARFDDAGGHPAIVERAFGRGRVTMVTTTADKEWHHWADHPTYLPVMMELVRHAARPSDRGSGLAVGQPIELAVDPAEYEPDALIRTPAYPDEREVSVTAGPAPDGRGLLMRWDHTESAGIYQFVLRKREGGETIRLVAVNVEGEEGDLAPADEGTLRGMMGEIPFDYMKGVAGLSGGTGEARTELWRLVLFAVAGVLMCEQVLAWRWGRRRG